MQAGTKDQIGEYVYIEGQKRGELNMFCLKDKAYSYPRFMGVRYTHIHLINKKQQKMRKE